MYQRAIQVDSVNKGALKGLLISSMDMFSFVETEKWFEYAEKNSSILSDNELTFMKARFSATQGNIEQGLEYLKNIRFRDKEMIEKVAYIEAEIAFYQQEYAKVVNKLAILINENSDFFYHLEDGQAAIHLSYAYQQLEEFKKADEVLNNFENYLQNSTSKSANSASFYYNMMAINILRNNENQALSYLQAAIDTGWVQTWKTKIEPIFSQLEKSQRFGRMIGGVIARLENMKASYGADLKFNL